jgi:hypothetical protein
MIEDTKQRLVHIERALIWITKQQEILEQKRIDYTILRAKLLTRR